MKFLSTALLMTLMLSLSQVLTAQQQFQRQESDSGSMRIVSYERRQEADFPAAGLPSFVSYQIQDGLSHSRVYALLEDRDGYIWIGTSNGLNRFDGREFRVFKHQDDAPSGLPDNYVTSLVQDRQGFIWVGTNGGGLGRMDPGTGRVLRYHTGAADPHLRLADDAVWGLLEDSKGRIWVSTSYGGISRISADRKRIDYFTAAKDTAAGGLSSNNIWPLLEDANGDIWIGSDGGGLNRWVESSGRIIHYRADGAEGSLSSDFIFSLYLDREGILWVGTAGGGLNRFDRRTSRFEAFTHDPDNENSISNNTVRSMLEDQDGRFWIGTTDGLNVMNRRTGSFIRIYHIPEDQRSLSHSRVHSLMEDSNGIVWIGTRDGVSRYTQPLFSTILLQGSGAEFARRNDVRSILPDSRGGAYIGSFDGLYHLPSLDEPVSGQRLILGDTIVYDLLPGNSGLYAATIDGLWYLNDTDEDTRPLLIDDSPIMDLHLDAAGRIWFATDTRGLGLYHPESGELMRFTPDSPTLSRISGWSINHISPVDEKRIVIAIRDMHPQVLNLETFELETPSWALEQDLRPSFILHQPETGWWLASEGRGLTLVSPQGILIKRYSGSDGLPSEVVKALQADDQGRIWISTIRGLGRVSTDGSRIEAFAEQDGLPGLIYNAGSIASWNSRLFFGSTQGIAWVIPGQIQPRVITSARSIEVFDSVNRDRNILAPDRKLVLPPDNRILLIRLTELDYRRSDSIRYAYRFSDQSEWIEIGSHGEILYSHLNPGNHEIFFRSSSHTGSWQDWSESLVISVLPPVFLRWFMFPLYGLLIASIAVWYSRRQSRQHVMLIREQEKLVENRTRELRKAKEDLEHAIRKKSTFFINLAHETKTPLTFIQNYLERSLARHGGDEDLAIVKENVDKLVRDMVNYLDTEKISQNADFYDHDQVTNLQRLLSPKLTMLSEVIGRHGLKLSMELDSELYLEADPLAVDRVVNNLIDNAIKYNSPGGRVEIRARRLEDGIRFSVRDSGPGISPDKLESLCDPFFQLSHPKQHLQGIGMGLYIVRRIAESLGTTLEIESTPGEGSAFSLLFPAAEKPAEEEGKTPAGPCSSLSPSGSLRSDRALPYYSFRQPPPPKPADSQTDPKLRQLLLVDDDTDMLQFLAQSLKGKFNLSFAVSPNEVINSLDERIMPDLIISDIMMEDMGGHEFLQKLQSSDWRSVPFIFLSARADRDEHLQSFHEGAVDFIPKPFALKDLIARIEARLVGQERRRQMLMESIQLRIQESLRPLKSSHSLQEDERKRRMLLHQVLDLSARERDILDLLLAGRIHKEMASQLGISVRTVEKHVYSLYRKAGVQNRAELIHFLQQNNPG